MNNNQSIIDFDDKIKMLLLKSLLINNYINKPTYEKVIRKYENAKRKEVA